MKKLTLRTVVSKGAVMRYNKTIILSNGMECCLRNGTESDGQLVVDNFNLILSILVDTFISKISLPMQPVPEIGSISVA